jgi:uncharacterized membrane protein YbhN (UPF0104 family)
VGYGVTQVISATRWWLLSRAAGIDSNFSRALSASFVGMYLNCFGLGTVGGDLAKAVLLTNNREKRQTSLAVVVADRGFGLAVLALIGVVASIWFYSAKLEQWVIYVAAGVIALVAVGWLLFPKILKLLTQNTRWAPHAERIAQGFPKTPHVMAGIFLVTMLFHVSQIALFAWLATAIGAQIPFGYLLMSIPFANIITTLPLSWMGLGLRENTYAFFFVPMFLSHEQAVLCGVLWWISMTLTGLFGGVVAVMGGSFAQIRSSRAPAVEAADTLSQK